MAQMNVSITDGLAAYVRGRVKSGLYNNASEVVREALRRMEEEEQRTKRMANPTIADVVTDFSHIEKERIRKRVLQSLAEIDRGEYTEYVGREGLDKLASEIKEKGRRKLSKAARS